eukprot:scaffold2565_cov384-Prasinococcus_capsulatus_cf.AAC.1
MHRQLSSPRSAAPSSVHAASSPASGSGRMRACLPARVLLTSLPVSEPRCVCRGLGGGRVVLERRPGQRVRHSHHRVAVGALAPVGRPAPGLDEHMPPVTSSSGGRAGPVKYGLGSCEG